MFFVKELLSLILVSLAKYTDASSNLSTTATKTFESLSEIQASTYGHERSINTYKTIKTSAYLLVLLPHIPNTQ